MKVWLRLLLIAVIVFNASSFVWFLLGSTAYFQRGMDIIGTSVLWGVALPVLLFVGLFTILVIKGWTPTDRGQYVAIFIGVIISIIISAALIQSVSTYGWANEKIESDTVKVTADKKYEYRVDLINLFQRNSHARLYLKDVGSGEEMYIPVDIQTRKIVGLGVGEVNHWVMLESTGNASQYVLYTTKELGIPEEKFKIDILSGTSIRVNYQQKNNMESDHSISKRPTETNSNNIEGSGSNAQNGARLELRKMSYVNRSVKISYPEIINLDDSEKEKRLNELLKHDALEAAKYFGGNEQGTEININYVPMLVGSNFISIQYVGSNYVKDGAYPNNIFSQLILM